MINKKKLIGGGILGVSLWAMLSGSTSELIPTFLGGGGGGGSVENNSPLYDDITNETPTPKVDLKISTGDNFLDYIIQEDANKYPDRSYNYNPKTGVTKISDSSGRVVGGFDSVNLQSITSERATATFNNPITQALNKSSGGGSSSRSSGGGSSSGSTPKTASKVSISTAKDPVKRAYENKNLVSTSKSVSQIKTENKIKSLFGGKY